MKGAFIVLEGIDGCGKSTMLKRLGEELFAMDKNHHVFLTREPYNREWLDQFLAQADAREKGEEALNGFVQDRLKHCRIIKQLLEEGALIISDRYQHSTYAYQMAQGIPFETINDAHHDVLPADLTIILDVPVDTAMERMDRRKDAFEQKAFLENVRHNYLSLKDKLNRNIIVIDGSQDKDAVYQDVKTAALDALKRKSL